VASKLNLGPVLKFLESLSLNNNKAWFDKHREEYESARDTFEKFVDDLIDKLRESDGLGDLTAKDCIPRINRDIRFSKDKSPYKTNFAATLAPGGKKAMLRGYHVSIGADEHSHIAGGLYMPTPEQLSKFRKAIASDASAFEKIVHAKPFVQHFGAVEGERLKTAPQGYDRDHPELELLQLKQVVAIHRFSVEDVLAPDFSKRIVTMSKAMKPFVDYLQEVAPE
jgi:uncharacterized protein (TIGR02453 family)